MRPVYVLSRDPIICCRLFAHQNCKAEASLQGTHISAPVTCACLVSCYHLLLPLICLVSLACSPWVAPSSYKIGKPPRPSGMFEEAEAFPHLSLA